MTDELADRLGYLNLFYLRDNWKDDLKKSEEKELTLHKDSSCI